MADSVMASSTKKPIFILDLSGQNSNPIIPDSFVINHLKGNIQSTKIKLTSDASDRAWEVELDGQRFSRGWKHFSVHHCIRNDDILSFRHDGDMVFHVTPFGRSFSHQIQYISSTSQAENDCSDDDDDEHTIFDDDVYDDDDDDDDDELDPNYTFPKKRARIETEPVLQLCPNAEGDNEIESEDCSEPDSMNQNKTVALVLKPYMLTGRLRVPALFGRANGIKEAGKITIVNKDDVEWKLHLGQMKGLFYIRGLKKCFVANGIKKVGDAFTLEAIRGGTDPILKISSKEASLDGYKTPQPRMIQASRDEEEKETRVQKKARVSAEGGPSHGTRASNRSNLQRTQPLQPCSISDHVTKVKQTVVDALTDVRKYKSELEIKEHYLEAALLEIDVLEEKIMGISKFFNMNQV